MSTLHERKGNWVRWVFGVTVAVAISAFLAGSITRDNQIADCIRASQFRIIDARAWEKAAEQHAKDGDAETARYFRSTAKQIRDTVVLGGDKQAQKGRRGDDPRSRERGCQRGFPPPFPFWNDITE